MFRNRVYYTLKPLVPWSVRIGIRRWLARRKLRRVAGSWPVYPGSEQRPAGWCGWPQGRQFACVLTHDVEGRKGLEQVRALAELELSLGFRSSFNFVPEGEYRVSGELRDWLTTNGFEVGVHDLRHDGKLYRHRRGFRHDAARINQYLKDWGAVGFRSGFMLNELDWLHDLNIQYDASTFDTDPFEPQPDGVGTIYPFWVPAPETKAESRNQKSDPTSEFQLSAFRSQLSEPSQPSTLNPQPSRKGYVELPYTLPQDSTLFLLLRESTPQVWFQKLDWIAEKGGMCLLNVHPDYLNFADGPGAPDRYPVTFYRDFLARLRERHAGAYWPALPREVAAALAPGLSGVAASVPTSDYDHGASRSH